MSAAIKNEQKYKTAKERVKAFIAYCKNKKECDHDSYRRKCPKLKCMMEWLALEAEAAKPEPCPFCGSVCRAEFDYVRCSNIRCRYVSADKKNIDEAIAAHNRVCRAVAAYNEGEVK